VPDRPDRVTIYTSDPERAPDADFVPGELALVVAGNRGRLLDARRTPVTVVAVRPATGDFEVEVGAFEDAGARWVLPLADVGRFQFARDAERADASELERAVARFDRPLEIACDPATRDTTLRRVADERDDAAAWLRGRLPAVDIDACIERRDGEPALYALVDERLEGLAGMDRAFATGFASHPGSGELVKGHAIVLAELGLCPYRGKVVRDPSTFDGDRSRERRADHLVARLAVTQALWSLLGRETVTLHRAAAVAGPLPAPRPASLVSATFSAAVAESHFEAEATAVRWRQVLGLDRLLMTFLETPALNAPYREAEAVLVADPWNRAF
jgi:hypothetical protein